MRFIEIYREDWTTHYWFGPLVIHRFHDDKPRKLKVEWHWKSWRTQDA